MLIFPLDVDPVFASALARQLDEALSQVEDRRFDDGEHKLRPLTDPRGEDCYVVSSLHGGPRESPRDKLLRLLFFVATLRDHGAARVTAVLPYLAYARKDRLTKPFDPLALRYTAQLLEAMGTAQLIVLEAHNPAALQNALRIPAMHLDAHRAFDAPMLDWAHEAGRDAPLAVVSPDPGGVKRAQLWREHLEALLARPVGFAMIDKRRSAGVVSSERLIAGDVEDATALLFDDLVATGETITAAARVLHKHRARKVIAFAAHGLFVPPAAEVLADAALTQVVVTDSVPPFRLPESGPAARKLRIVSVVPLIAQAVRDSHQAWIR